ncbi:hypothetical protein LKD37_01845 [Oscillospiraceae bacterium CLA-AA-H272]|uniref:Uncharacterized protein n=1 Tax=Brotocaccenecus cirricatena TaxID=3064195 RepID=A0AAE3AE33_9FIRM|nr:hypothetical protein [Brotocaccenecus cirricatena]MCC2128273.1 hypothetical protein [Brotocaccenecus cirricatena]
MSAREQPQAIRCDSLRLSVIFDYGIPRRGDPSMWKGTLICINSKNVSCLDCLWVGTLRQHQQLIFADIRQIALSRCVFAKQCAIRIDKKQKERYNNVIIDNDIII